MPTALRIISVVIPLIHLRDSHSVSNPLRNNERISWSPPSSSTNSAHIGIGRNFTLNALIACRSNSLASFSITTYSTVATTSYSTSQPPVAINLAKVLSP